MSHSLPGLATRTYTSATASRFLGNIGESLRVDEDEYRDYEVGSEDDNASGVIGEYNPPIEMLESTTVTIMEREA